MATLKAGLYWAEYLGPPHVGETEPRIMEKNAVVLVCGEEPWLTMRQVYPRVSSGLDSPNNYRLKTRIEPT